MTVFTANAPRFLVSAAFSVLTAIAVALGASKAEDFQKSIVYEAIPVFESRLLTDEDFSSMDGLSWKEGCPVAPGDLRLLTVTYLGFDGLVRRGSVVCHSLVADELRDIFKEIYEADFPIARIEPIDAYEADDSLSMAADNTSAFNYRTVSGSKNLSKHAYGLAIDINPVENPYVENGGAYVSPEAGRAYVDRSNVRQGMIVKGDAVFEAFTSRGWFWGGDWKYQIDYQHFQKTIAPAS